MRHSWIIDPSKCTGCKSCEVVCSLYHHNEVNLNKSRIRVVKWEEEGLDVPVVCQHCERPLCVENCPTGALYRDGENACVSYRKDLCIGCKLCLLTCPCGGIGLPEDGSIMKCDLCGGDPVCTKFCLSKAIEFMPNSQVEERQKKKAARALIQNRELLDGENTQPG